VTRCFGSRVHGIISWLHSANICGGLAANKGASVEWNDVNTLKSRRYICGYCDSPLAADKGYWATKRYVPSGSGTSKKRDAGYIYICHECGGPTYFDGNGRQFPGPPYGETVTSVPSKEVEALYEEARACMQVNAYTAAVMCCRKLLMNVAVSEGADEGKTFAYYVKYLADEGHIPVKAIKWVDYIRDKGNDANHEIRIMGREDAERLIRFSEMLLRIMYEYPAEVEDPS
jgi:hypothetical protein